MKKWISSNEEAVWKTRQAYAEVPGEILNIKDTVIGKPLYGFGCCISEVCVKAIHSLPTEKAEQIYDALFGESGCGFDFCRLSVGANDFAENWYSYNECEGDYEMKHFSIERDQKYIIPAIRKAQQRSPEIQFISSPWSPPTWMKYSAVYNYGRMIEEEKNLQA